MKTNLMTRRSMLSGMTAFAAFPVIGGAAKAFVGGLPRWKAGELEIHFIQTGVGEQTFFRLPDGTTMLLDCGDMYREKYLPDIPRRPSAERLGGEWVSRYVRRLVDERTLDYFVLTHWHADHCGKPSLRSEKTADGRAVCGVTRFAEDFGFRHYFDHQYPADPAANDLNFDADSVAMMRAWLPLMQKRCGMIPHAFKVGAKNQIALLRDPGRYPDFEIRNLFANGLYWDGNSSVIDYRPRYAELRPQLKGKVVENSLSLGFRIRYGRFSAYFGGDIDFPDHEARLAPVVGAVDICKMNHHGCPTSMGAPFCRAVRAQVYFSSTWSPNQITERNLVNMASRELYPGERVILPGFLPPAKRAAFAGQAFLRDFLPAQGHVVFKVAPGGGAFELFVLSNEDESMEVLYRRSFISGANA